MPINPQDRIKNKPSEPPTDSLDALDALDPSGDSVGSSLRSTGNFQKIMYVSAGVAVLIIIIVAITMYVKSSGNEKASAEPQKNVLVDNSAKPEGTQSDKPWLSGNSQTSAQQTPVKSEEKTSESTEPPVASEPPGNSVKPGLTDISKNTVDTNLTSVEEDTFVKDLNELDVNEKFVIDSIYTTVDFVSYTKKRAVTGSGVELYWLDAQYKGKPAKVQVPFTIFKELDPVGVTAVDVEVVRIKNKDNTRQEIATNFVVRTDYKKVMEQQAKKKQ